MGLLWLNRHSYTKPLRRGLVLISNDIEIPDECPSDCPEAKSPFDQSSLCIRCPILNCKQHLVPEILGGSGNYFRLIEPSDYRRDWAVEFKKWFDTGMKGLPELRLQR